MGILGKSKCDCGNGCHLLCSALCDFETFHNFSSYDMRAFTCNVKTTGHRIRFYSTIDCKTVDLVRVQCISLFSLFSLFTFCNTISISDRWDLILSFLTRLWIYKQCLGKFIDFSYNLLLISNNIVNMLGFILVRRLFLRFSKISPADFPRLHY